MSQFTNEQVAELATKLQFLEGDIESFCDKIFEKLHKEADEIREELFKYYTFHTIELDNDSFDFEEKTAKSLTDKLSEINEKILLLQRVLDYVDK